MKKISTGDDSTVGTYMTIAKFFGPNVQNFMAEYEKKYGKDEEIIAEESQMMILFASLMGQPELKEDELGKYLERLGV